MSVFSIWYNKLFSNSNLEGMWSRKNIDCLSKDLHIWLMNKFCLSKACSFQWSRTTNGSKGKDWDINVSNWASEFPRQPLDNMVKYNTQRWEGRDTKYSAVKWAHSNYAKRSCVFKQMNVIYWITPPWRNCFLIIFSLDEDPSSTACFYFHWKRQFSFKKKRRVEIKTTFTIPTFFQEEMIERKYFI